MTEQFERARTHEPTHEGHVARRKQADGRSTKRAERTNTNETQSAANERFAESEKTKSLACVPVAHEHFAEAGIARAPLHQLRPGTNKSSDPLRRTPRDEDSRGKLAAEQQARISGRSRRYTALNAKPATDRRTQKRTGNRFRRFFRTRQVRHTARINHDKSLPSNKDRPGCAGS